MTNQSAPLCPRCGQLDKAQKISSLFSQGYTTVEYAPPGSIIGTSTASSMTLLADRLKPPPKPEEPKKPGCGLYSLLPIAGAFLGGFVGMLIFGDNVIPAIFALIGFFVPIFLYSTKVYKPKMVEYERAKPIWEQAMRRWSELYYCSRDDCIFDPSTGDHDTPENMRKLIGG